MPFVTRVRVPRRAQPALRLQSGDHQWSICYPDPDDPIVIAGFGEAAMLATACATCLGFASPATSAPAGTHVVLDSSGSHLYGYVRSASPARCGA